MINNCQINTDDIVRKMNISYIIIHKHLGMSKVLAFRMVIKNLNGTLGIYKENTGGTSMDV